MATQQTNHKTKKLLHHQTQLHPPKSCLPRKRFYRARAHSNPLSDSHFPVPICPSHIDWSHHFPAYFRPFHNGSDVKSAAVQKSGVSDDSNAQETSQENAMNASWKTAAEMKVRFADLGCGFGGLLIKLSPMFPETLMIGMELRDKVSEYVRERILAMRKENPGQYDNISIVRNNAMKYLPNYFEKGQLQKMFFLFPDPHFKEKNHRRRVISVALLAEYAHVMAVGGVLYTITDVRELAEWMTSCLQAHPLFEEVPLEEQDEDPVVKLLKIATEEGQKVQRNNGETFQSVYRRVLCHNTGA